MQFIVYNIHVKYVFYITLYKRVVMKNHIELYELYKSFKKLT